MCVESFSGKNGIDIKHAQNCNKKSFHCLKHFGDVEPVSIKDSNLSNANFKNCFQEIYYTNTKICKSFEVKANLVADFILICVLHIWPLFFQEKK